VLSQIKPQAPGLLLRKFSLWPDYLLSITFHLYNGIDTHPYLVSEPSPVPGGTYGAWMRIAYCSISVSSYYPQVTNLATSSVNLRLSITEL